MRNLKRFHKKKQKKKTIHHGFRSLYLYTFDGDVEWSRKRIKKSIQNYINSKEKYSTVYRHHLELLFIIGTELMKLRQIVRRVQSS